MDKQYPIIATITARAGSGKTEFAKALLRRGQKIVCSNTTRDPREGEINGEAPYYHFVDISKYMDVVVTEGLVSTGDLSRGDDIVLADTVYGEKTYWTKVSDVFIDRPVVFYIIDPVGVVSLKKAKDKARELIKKFGWDKDQAPNLHFLANSEIFPISLQGDTLLYNQVSEDRKKRDADQELGWAVCESISAVNFHNPFTPDKITMLRYMDQAADILLTKIMMGIGAKF